MADFRRWFLAFAALVLVLGSAVPASAQTSGPQVTCSVNAAVTPTLRHEGLTELVGDILLVCQGTPGSTRITTGNVPQADISVTIGGYALSTSTVGGGLDALLLVDDPSPANQKVCPTPSNGFSCTVAANGGGGYNVDNTRYNVFQGINTPAPGLNSISFLGVPVDPPATGVLTYRITNIRIQPFPVGQGVGVLTPVYAFVSTSSSTSITIPPTQSPVVGYISPGLIFSATGTNPSLLQCLSYDDTTTVGALTFAEGFPNAFKIQNAPGCAPTTTNLESLAGCQTQPGAVYYTESGLQVPVTGGTTGFASTATELEAVITNVPAGVEIWVDGSYTDPNTGISASIISPTAIATDGTKVEVLGTGGGTVTVVWGITNSNPLAYPGSLVFNVYTSFTGVPGSPTGSPTPNAIAYVQGGFAPQKSGWANGDPVPEFGLGLVPATPGTSLFQVSLCQTILLFPYVTDFYGFDTGIAISNTSLDNLPVPANPQTGSCSVAFYSGGALAANIGTTGNTPGYVNSDAVYGAGTEINGTGLIMPGQTWAFSMSGSDSTYNSAAGSGSTGYAIATCNFQFAHGYSFVSDTGIRNFAAAYLALVIPDAPRTPNPFICPTLPLGYCSGEAGEQLVH